MVAMGVWMSFFALGAWGALYAYTPEAYPTSLRGTGMGTASGMTRIAGAIAPSLGAAFDGRRPTSAFDGVCDRLCCRRGRRICPTARDDRETSPGRSDIERLEKKTETV